MFGFFKRREPVEVGRFQVLPEPPYWGRIYADGDRLVDEDGEDWTLSIADALGCDPARAVDDLRRAGGRSD